jgi:hypothetical protein
MNITITPRINFASDTSALLVGRDSPQAATRVLHPTCTNQIPKRDGTFATVQHCGGVSECKPGCGAKPTLILWMR